MSDDPEESGPDSMEIDGMLRTRGDRWEIEHNIWTVKSFPMFRASPTAGFEVANYPLLTRTENGKAIKRVFVSGTLHPYRKYGSGLTIVKDAESASDAPDGQSVKPKPAKSNNPELPDDLMEELNGGVFLGMASDPIAFLRDLVSKHVKPRRKAMQATLRLMNDEPIFCELGNANSEAKEAIKQILIESMKPNPG